MLVYICWLLWIVLSVISTTQSNQYSVEPFQMKTEYLNKRLVGYCLYERKVSGLHECARECMFLRACESINYIAYNKSCEFNSEGSETVNASDFVASWRTIFSDISVWPQSMAMSCAFHTCGPKQRCLPIGNEAHKCVDIACNKPGNTQYGIVNSGSNTVGSVRTYKYTCPQRMAVRGDRTITCLLNGEWSSVASYCEEKTLGAECNSSAECKETGSECILGKCFCGRLYRYKDDINDCVKVCSNMTNTFTVHAFTRIIGYNDRHAVQGNDIELESCRQRCTEDPDCLSFESGPFSHKFVCRESSVSLGMIEDTVPELISNGTFDTYTRDCI